MLKPGGCAAFLDFSKPWTKSFQTLEDFVLRIWCGLFGWLLRGNAEVYSYIAASLRQFPDRATFHGLLKENGFTVIESRLFFFGVIERVSMRNGA